MRILIAATAVASMTGLTFAQTQPTRPSALCDRPDDALRLRDRTYQSMLLGPIERARFWIFS